MSISLLEQLKSLLPESQQAALHALATTTITSEKSLQVTLVGAFSVGKSSLLNRLLGEPLLQTAREETTALPTFIQYGEQRELFLVSSDHRLRRLHEQAFAEVTTQAPEGAICAILRLPRDWLQGVSIIDLPGLGSLSTSHQEYTLAQIQQADAILYLLDPRGPTQSDMSILAQIHQYAKRVKVVVARWDEVKASIDRGEKAPSLEQWTQQIARETGLQTRLDVTDQSGVGCEAVIDFITQARAELAEIRCQRFQAALRPVLENALGHNAHAQEACQAESEQAAQQVHQELMQRKQALLALKTDVYAQQHKDYENLSQHALQHIETQRIELVTQLRMQASEVFSEADLDELAKNGMAALRERLNALAKALYKLSTDHGTLQLPAAQIAHLDLRLPKPESIDPMDFLDRGKVAQLEQQLNERQDEIVELEQKLRHLPEDAVQQLSTIEQQLRDIVLKRQHIASQPLPKIIRELEKQRGSAAVLGRTMGEFADIALILFAPLFAGAKGAALLGKGAKMASSTVKVAKAVQISGIPPEVLGPVGRLEMLSFGYWGERFGSMVDGSNTPIQEEIIDPQARAAQQSNLAQIDHEIARLRSNMARNEELANQRQLSDWALEQNRKEQQRLKEQLEALDRQAREKRDEAEKLQQQTREKLLQREVEKAVNRWQQSFEQQSLGMLNHLQAHSKQYWEEKINQLVEERLADIEPLVAQLQAKPEEKQAQLVRLQQEAAHLHTALTLLVPTPSV